MPIKDIRTTTDDDALKVLKQLLEHQPGLLKYVRPEHLCMEPPGIPMTADEFMACRNYALNHRRDEFYVNMLADPLHYLTVPVVQIDGPFPGGSVAVVALDGSRSLSTPLKVLRKALAIGIARGEILLNGLGELRIPAGATVIAPAPATTRLRAFPGG